MNKKILLFYSLFVFMLVSITLVSSLSINRSIKKEESPLFKIRTFGVIKDNINELKGDLKERFIGDRVFFIRMPILNYMTQNRHLHTGDGRYTCSWTLCDYCTNILVGCTNNYDCTLCCKYPLPSIFTDCD